MRDLRLKLLASTLVLASAPSTGLARSPVLGEVRITAEKMCCKGCAQKVSSQLYALKGVTSVEVDLTTHTVNMTLPSPSATTLGRIWHAVEQVDGGPKLLSTSSASYQLVGAQNEQELRALEEMGATQHIEIENLHCKGCAQKIAAQLYSLKGVTKVSVDLERETLIIETNPKSPVSPWLMIDAVASAKERPVAVRGSYGTLAITWTSGSSPKSDHQAQQAVLGEMKR